jgi:outer membrane immunogenic protein
VVATPKAPFLAFCVEFMETMMRKLFLASAALVLTTPVLAADLSPPAEPVQVLPQGFDWSGFYIGVNAGYGFAGSFEDRVGINLDNADGFVGGVQAGYNASFDPLVLGIEGELDYANISDQNGIFEGNLNWRGSLTPRLGFAVEQFMPYIKGGVAFGSVEIKTPGVSDDQVLVGWTIGAGAEYLITNNVSVRAEYNYTDLNSDNFAVTGGVIEAGYHGSDVKAGVNYKF